jgi:hypothetical protein
MLERHQQRRALLRREALVELSVEFGNQTEVLSMEVHCAPIEKLAKGRVNPRRPSQAGTLVTFRTLLLCLTTLRMDQTGEYKGKLMLR